MRKLGRLAIVVGLAIGLLLPTTSLAGVIPCAPLCPPPATPPAAQPGPTPAPTNPTHNKAAAAPLDIHVDLTPKRVHPGAVQKLTVTVGHLSASIAPPFSLLADGSEAAPASRVFFRASVHFPGQVPPGVHRAHLNGKGKRVISWRVPSTAPPGKGKVVVLIRDKAIRFTETLPSLPFTVLK